MFKFLRSSVTTFLFLLAFSAAFLFVVKHKVQRLDKELKQITNEMNQEQENIHILSAEYSYLANPKRVKTLIVKHLSLKTVEPTNIFEEKDIPKLLAAARQKNRGVN